MLPAIDVSHLPPAARSLVHSSLNSFVSTDRGHIRRHNDSALESRARHFAGWIETAGFTVDSLEQLDPALFPSLLAAYLSSVAAGDNCQNNKNLTDQTLRGYVSAASNATTLLTSKPCSYLDPSTLSSKRTKTLPMISKIFRQRSSWTTPRPRKEPFTLAMIDAPHQ
jgi:hypothetical protein